MKSRSMPVKQYIYGGLSDSLGEYVVHSYITFLCTVVSWYHFLAQCLYMHFCKVLHIARHHFLLAFGIGKMELKGEAHRLDCLFPQACLSFPNIESTCRLHNVIFDAAHKQGAFVGKK